MTLTQLWGVVLLLGVCPLLGGLPLIRWTTWAIARRDLTQLGTRNISVSAAFYHGGRAAGLAAVCSEALKGIAAVLLARAFFPTQPVWEVVALIALVMGRYWFGRGAGTTNVVWGVIIHDWVTAGLLFLLSAISFTILREKHAGRMGVLLLLPLLVALRHPEDGARIGATVTLCFLLGWIYQKIPDDLELSASEAQPESKAMFKFFRGDRALLSLDQPLKAEKVGAKAATLAALKRQGYPVPMGWVLPPGDDPTPLIEALAPTPEAPLIVRSSAIGEDTELASAAGQYESIPNITSRAALQQAILRCQASYNAASAVQYRQRLGLPEKGMAVLVQPQVGGVFSGVAFSRDPVSRQGEAVVIEALPGNASRVVSGKITPEQYRVLIREESTTPTLRVEQPAWVLPDTMPLEMQGEGDVPPRLIQQVAYLARHLERQKLGVPQDVEWTYDGQQLWILQARPITTLLPIWTRKIAAEVIPGFIRPLTWSINRPLTCGVWGEIFTVVLGDRARGLDFEATATLHHAAAYFNASLLGEIFLRMGLPPESLEFLTRGAKFSKPPLLSTLRNTPGLLRLIRRELRLGKDFHWDNQKYFAPGLAILAHQSVDSLTPAELLSRIDRILELLRKATYYSILVPLSLAVRQALFKVPETALDNSQTPEVASLRSLQVLASMARSVLPNRTELSPQSACLFAALAESQDGQVVLQQFNQFLDQYGYLSDAATDIAVPRWQEDPQPVRELFTQLVFNPLPQTTSGQVAHTVNARHVQPRLHLKGRVTVVYSRLLAELRWSFIALERQWVQMGLLQESGDLFFLEFDEIRNVIEGKDARFMQHIPKLVERRRSQYLQDQQRSPIPTLVYGNDPPTLSTPVFFPGENAAKHLRGIGASPGQAEGRVLVLHNLQNIPAVDQATILVVPYTDSGWAPLLARVGGIIAEAGGQLSHGAIIAREYNIPAVMDVHQATQKLSNGQWVRIDGQQGIVELL